MLYNEKLIFYHLTSQVNQQVIIMFRLLKQVLTSFLLLMGVALITVCHTYLLKTM